MSFETLVPQRRLIGVRSFPLTTIDHHGHRDNDAANNAHYAHRMNHRIVCFGELLLRLSAPGKELLLQSPAFNAHIGGAEANVAVSLTLLGHDAAFVTALPDNKLADASLGEMRKHGVDTHRAIRRPGRMGMYYLTQGAGHRPSEVLYDRANSVFATAHSNAYDWPDALAGAGWLHVSGITPAVSANAALAAREAMQAARALNLRVSFDCNYRPQLWGARASEAPALLRELCSLATLIFGDERDIGLIFGRDFSALPSDQRGREAAKIAFEAFPSLEWMASTTRGRNAGDAQELGGLLRNRMHTYASRIIPLGTVVDRIGSGDAYAAGIVDQLLRGSDPQAAVEFAAAAAVLKHSIPGDFNLSRRADIESLVAGHAIDVRR